MPDERIILDLKVNQDQPSTFMAVDAPTIKARGIKTQVIVKNGETVVLGGIYEYSQIENIIMGSFFRYFTHYRSIISFN